MSNLPTVRTHPPDMLWAEKRRECVAVTGWDGQISGALAIGDDSMDEWLKYEGEAVPVALYR